MKTVLAESTLLEDKEQLVEKLRRKIHGVTRNAMTPSNLTEKNWLVIINYIEWYAKIFCRSLNSKILL